MGPHALDGCPWSPGPLLGLVCLFNLQEFPEIFVVNHVCVIRVDSDEMAQVYEAVCVDLCEPERHVSFLHAYYFGFDGDFKEAAGPDQFYAHQALGALGNHFLGFNQHSAKADISHAAGDELGFARGHSYGRLKINPSKFSFPFGQRLILCVWYQGATPLRLAEG
jgi:hypothetical protein